MKMTAHIIIGIAVAIVNIFLIWFFGGLILWDDNGVRNIMQEMVVMYIPLICTIVGLILLTQKVRWGYVLLAVPILVISYYWFIYDVFPYIGKTQPNYNPTYEVVSD